MNPSFTRLSMIGAMVAAIAGCTQATDDDFESSTDSIVGGEEAAEGAWPGAAALYKGGSRPSCGGTLIHPSWVMTAGHCVSTSATGGVSKVVVGRHKLSSSAGETRKVDKAIRHAGYANLDNDIALLHLTEPSTMPVATLVTSAQLSAVVPDAETTVVGWGVTTEGGSASDVLRQVSVPIIANEKCKTYSRYERVTENMICAGLEAGQKDSCQGDSGGPLYIELGGKHVEIGIVSWGIGCARAKAPGVYTRVGNYLNWIYEKTEGAVGEPPSTPPTGDPRYFR